MPRKRRRKKRNPGPPAWSKVPIVELRGKAAFLDCVVEPISTPAGTRKWMLVVPGQSIGRIAARRNAQRFRSERKALIEGIRWVYKYVYQRKE